MAQTCRPRCSTVKNIIALFLGIYLSYCLGRIGGAWHGPSGSAAAGQLSNSLRTSSVAPQEPLTARPPHSSKPNAPNQVPDAGLKGAASLNPVAPVSVQAARPPAAGALKPATKLNTDAKATEQDAQPAAEPNGKATPPAPATKDQPKAPPADKATPPAPTTKDQPKAPPADKATPPASVGDLEIADALPPTGQWEWTEAQSRAWLIAHGVAKENLVRPEANVPPTPPQPPVDEALQVPVLRLPEDERRSPPRRSAAEELAYLNSSMPAGRPEPWMGDYQEQCGKYHKRHAIVTMATGDNAARMAIGLVQSLRDVGTCEAIDIVVMVFGGGVGSTDCREGRTKGLWKSFCSVTEPQRLELVFGQIFVKALLRLNVKFHLAPPLPHHANGLKSVNIPGGSQIWWGMALNKLSVFNMTQYDKVLWLDGDVFVNKNLDHLLFYPEATAAFTQECCMRNSAPKMSGGMWVVEPSERRMAQIMHLISNESPLVPLGYEQRSWQYGDMNVVLTLFIHLAKAPPFPSFPGSICTRQSRSGIREMYSLDNPRLKQWKPYSSGVSLAGPDDITVIQLDSEQMQGGHWLAPESAANVADPVALQVGAPPGRVWHMLNASYDWLPGECDCMSSIRPLDPDFYFSVHFTCMPPGAGKPASFHHIADWVTLPKIPECVKPWYRRWLETFARAMGDDFPHSVFYSRS